MHRYDDARGAYTQAVELEPNDKTWKEALYKILEMTASVHGAKNNMLSELQGLKTLNASKIGSGLNSSAVGYLRVPLQYLPLNCSDNPGVTGVFYRGTRRYGEEGAPELTIMHTDLANTNAPYTMQHIARTDLGHDTTPIHLLMNSNVTVTGPPHQQKPGNS
jgi:hypothetical protein